jgi:dihydrolipoamide dehydrogenase|tara:strand:+ start:918 stop:2330 length:1413 start_codon:yes stop_codon:yes gene_type:complete
MSQKFDAVVIGGGPGGYVCAIRLAQLGKKTACIESRGSLGGTCLNIGCIPSKSLLNLSENFHKAKNFQKIGIEIGSLILNLDKMMKNKEKVVTVLTKGIEFLFKKNKVTYFKGTGSITGTNQISINSNNNQNEIIDTKNIIIATGSDAVSLPGIEFDEEKIISSTGALSLKSVPKKLVIVGGGYIGLEMGSVWSRLGSEVQVIEFLDHITPGMDKEISNEFQKILKKQGINFNLKTKVESISKAKKFLTDKTIVKTTDEQGNKKQFDCDVVLISVGRKPNTSNLNLEKIGVEKDQKGRIKVDKNFQTSIKNIFAIGDVIEGPMLAHKAEEEGMAVAEIIVGQSGHVNYDIIPSVVYTSPEVASVGKTEEQLKSSKMDYKIGKFPFMANSRAKAIDEPEGFVKILADSKTDRVLGVHIIGSHAGEMIAEMAVAMEFGASSEDIARTCHAHPTFSEAIKEAALSVDKRQIHS